MSTAQASDTKSKAMFWIGWVLSILPCLMLLMSAYFKFNPPPEAKDSLQHLAWPEHTMIALGIIELGCMVLYLIPQTAVLSAILLTGYLGGAISAHVRAGDGYRQFGIPLAIGVVIWLGLFLRDPRVRALIPLRNPKA